MEKNKKHRTVRLKEKDINLFDFISKFGFATVEQINSYLGGSLNSLKTRLSHLVNDGYLINHRIFYGKPSVYTVTQKACSENLSMVKQISVGKYEHDLLVIDVFLKLKNKFTEYYTERMIRSERGIGIGKKGRIPDLKGFTQENKVIAIEVDRTDKSLERLRAIIASYGLNSEIDEVWFICSSRLIFNNIEKVNSSYKVKIFHLKDVLDGKELHYTSPKNLQERTKEEIIKFYQGGAKIEESEIKEVILHVEKQQLGSESLNKGNEAIACETVKKQEDEKETVSKPLLKRIDPYKFSSADDVLKDFLSDHNNMPTRKQEQNITLAQKNNQPISKNNQKEEIKNVEDNNQENLSGIQEDEKRKEKVEKSRGLFNPFKHLRTK
jgi:hypothetical protein